MGSVADGIVELNAGRIKKAEALFARGCFLEGDSEAAGYLSMLYYDEKITRRTEESVSAARLLWAMTKEERSSASHRLGYQYLTSPRKDVRKKGAELIRNAERQGYANAYCLSGILYYQEKDYDKAVTSLSKYPNIDKDKEPMKMYAESLEKKTHPDLARAAVYYEKYGKLTGDDKAFRKASELYYNSDDFDGGIRCLLQITGEKTPSEYGKLGSHFAYAGRTEAELKRAEEYLRIAFSKGYHDNTGMATLCKKLGREKEACRYYLSALKDGVTSVQTELLPLLMKLRKSDPEIAGEWPEERIVRLALDIEANFGTEAIEESDYSEELHVLLARAFFKGAGVARNSAKAFEYARKEPDNPACMYYLGMIAMEGLSVGISPDDAINLIHLSSVNGFPEAIMTMGDFYNSQKEWTKALDLYMRAYSAGCKPAAGRIADMYEEGYIGKTVFGMPNRRVAKDWRNKSKE